MNNNTISVSGCSSLRKEIEQEAKKRDMTISAWVRRAMRRQILSDRRNRQERQAREVIIKNFSPRGE